MRINFKPEHNRKTGENEDDSEKIYKKYAGIKLAAWETVKQYSFTDGFKLTVTEGDLTKKEEEELKGLLKSWGENGPNMRMPR